MALDGRRTGHEDDRDFYLACNAWIEPVAFRIPLSPSGRSWRRAVDTGLPSPDDILPLEEGPRVLPNESYTLAPFSMIVLISEE
jgi:glycogen operon protein